MKKLIVLTFFAVFLTVTAANAEESLFDPITIKATGGMISDADFKDSGGSAQVKTGRISIKSGGFSFGYTAKNYTWSDKQRLNFGNGSDDPWNTLQRLTLGYEHEGEINDNWAYSAEITGSSSFEKEMSGSFGSALRGGFMYTFNDNWKTMFGGRIFVNSIETEIMPYLGVMYENFDTDGSGAFMTLGAPSTEVGYAFSKDSKLRATFDMDGSTTRLKDDSTVARKGYLQTSSMVTGLYYDWNPTDAFSISFGPEYHFGREMKLYDNDGNKFGNTIKQDSAMGGRLQFGYEF